MSIKDDIWAVLSQADYNPSKVDVDRDGTMRGRDSLHVYVMLERPVGLSCDMWGHFDFAKDNKLSGEEIAHLVKQHFDVEIGERNG